MRSNLSRFLNGEANCPQLRIVILGVGNDLNGDDAAGVLVARRLVVWFRKRAGQLPPFKENPLTFDCGRLLVIDAGPSPESFTGPLRRYQPDFVFLVDAAEMGELPGAVRVFNWNAAQGMSALTHGMPPTLLAKYLVDELDCRVILVGIQPRQLDLDAPVSIEVRRSIRRVTANFQSLIERRF